MAEYADLEIRLRRQSPETPGTYAVALRFTIPGSTIDYRLLEGTPLVALDVKRMLRHATAQAYGRGLSEAFFTDAGLLDAFTRARDLARHDGLPLRLRLFVDHRAQELHKVHWETLADPKETGRFLFTDEKLPFSRYLDSDVVGRYRPPDQADLKALVVIADTGDKVVGLAPVDVEGERTRARRGLGDIPVTELASGGRANLEAIKKWSRGGPPTAPSRRLSHRTWRATRRCWRCTRRWWRGPPADKDVGGAGAWPGQHSGHEVEPGIAPFP